MTNAVARTQLTESEVDALATLAHVAVSTTPTHHVRGSHASALLAYMSRLEGERNDLRTALTARDIEIERLKKFVPFCKCDPTGWNVNPIPPPCKHFEWDGGTDKVKVCATCEHDETCHAEAV